MCLICVCGLLRYQIVVTVLTNYLRVDRSIRVCRKRKTQFADPECVRVASDSQCPFAERLLAVAQFDGARRNEKIGYTTN